MKKIQKNIPPPFGRGGGRIWNEQYSTTYTWRVWRKFALSKTFYEFKHTHIHIIFLFLFETKKSIITSSVILFFTTRIMNGEMNIFQFGTRAIKDLSFSKDLILFLKKHRFSKNNSKSFEKKTTLIDTSPYGWVDFLEKKGRGKENKTSGKKIKIFLLFFMFTISSSSSIFRASGK